ncbi:MAG: hypothetical protein SVX38_13155 [Chloroflexota bacterium]|nr:hypothetical protein [Chloroflexota bacterium]
MSVRVVAVIRRSGTVDEEDIYASAAIVVPDALFTADVSLATSVAPGSRLAPRGRGGKRRREIRRLSDKLP